MRKPKKSEIDRARDFSELVDSNEEHMGEMAAFYVACEQFQIDEEEGWELLSLIALDEEDSND